MGGRRHGHLAASGEAFAPRIPGNRVLESLQRRRSLPDVQRENKPWPPTSAALYIAAMPTSAGSHATVGLMVLTACTKAAATAYSRLQIGSLTTALADRSGAQQLAPVHRQHLPVELPRVGRGKEQRHLGDLVWRAHSACRDALAGAFVERRVVCLALIPHAAREFH